MSCKKRTRRTQPYEVPKISLDNSNRRVRRKPPKLCPGRNNETNDCVNSKLNRIEELVDNFPKIYPKNDAKQSSIFNVKFILNSVPCEVEYDLSKFTFENLQKLAFHTSTQTFNDNFNNKFPSCNQNDQND